MFELLNMDISVFWCTVMAFSLSLILSLVLGGYVIELLHKHQKTGQPIRSDGPKSHLQTKKGTPTMGGLLILGTAILPILMFANIKYHFVWVSLLVLIIYGITGFVDDYWKVKRQNSNAMTAKMKLFLQFLTAIIAASIITSATPRGINTVLTFPYFTDLFLNLSWLYIPFAVIVISGTSNGVNLSDGLDGLASGLLIASFSVFMIIAYYCGLHNAVDYNLIFIPRCSEI